jgi:16S rRNA (cytosine967-C5)-methyltransferase
MRSDKKVACGRQPEDTFVLMDQRIARFAARVIELSDRENRSDQVLRAELRRVQFLDPNQPGEAARAVFNFFRWQGWLTAAEPLPRQVEAATDLANRFVRSPGSFKDEDLVSRAVPEWAQETMDVSAEWVRAIQTEPSLWLRARPGQGAALAEELEAERPLAHLPDTLRYLGWEDLFRTPAFHEGLFEIQDLSSQAVGWLCAPEPGQTWWDACAGEGGKTLHLSDLMQNKGLIWATDRAAWRLQQLKRRAGRARVFNYRTAPWDGSEKLPTKTRFDGVLVDAPCSGVGTWQKNPQARWTTTRQDVEELAEIQFQLVTRAARLLKPGGRLVYSVCTLARPETEEVVRRVQAATQELEPCLVPNPVAGGEPAAVHWFRPEDYGATGMFVALWRRT